MNNRQKILTALTDRQVPEVSLPNLQRDWTTYPDPKAQFVEVLEGGGGKALEVSGSDSISAGLQRIEAYREAKNICSTVSGIPSTGEEWSGLKDPHEFETLECCVVPGEFAVAENAAVWLTDKSIPCRAALFVTQHLVLVVPSSGILQNMHEAYAKISFDDVRFGIFVSGPSKTADIEQSLVIGAHGARSLTVVLVGGPTD